MALLVEEKTSKSFVIGVNANGELGLGDKNQRKQLVSIPELKDKRLKQAAVGYSGYVIAVERDDGRTAEYPLQRSEKPKDVDKTKGFRTFSGEYRIEKKARDDDDKDDAWKKVFLNKNSCENSCESEFNNFEIMKAKIKHLES